LISGASQVVEGLKPETIHNRAYVLSGKSEIKARVKALLDEKQAKEQWNRLMSWIG
jgi:hypothetical protein